MSVSDPLSGAAGVSAREVARKANVKKGLIIVHTGHGTRRADLSLARRSGAAESHGALK
jgi:hypothetical protein